MPHEHPACENVMHTQVLLKCEIYTGNTLNCLYTKLWLKNTCFGPISSSMPYPTNDLNKMFYFKIYLQVKMHYLWSLDNNWWQTTAISDISTKTIYTCKVKCVMQSYWAFIATQINQMY